MINLSSGRSDSGDPPRPVADPDFWRAAIRRHAAPTEPPPAVPAVPPRCRRCREGPCPTRGRAERRLIGALRERWDGGGPVW
jgi:hypothetical protein